MAEKKWIAKAVPESHKGRLHSALGVPQGEKIPRAKIAAAANSENPHLAKMAHLAETFAAMRHKKG